MNSLFPVSLATVSFFLVGCVGEGPNTHRGAVIGGVLGTVAGAVLGHNSGGGDAFGGALLGATAGALAGGAIGNTKDHERGTLYGSSYERVDRGQQYTVAYPPIPPAPTETEVFTAPPAPNAIWIPGYWSYDGRAYTWVTGHWEVPPPAATTYVTAHWETRADQYVFVPSYWR